MTIVMIPKQICAHDSWPLESLLNEFAAQKAIGSRLFLVAVGEGADARFSPPAGIVSRAVRTAPDDCDGGRRPRWRARRDLDLPSRLGGTFTACGLAERHCVQRYSDLARARTAASQRTDRARAGRGMDDHQRERGLPLPRQRSGMDRRSLDGYWGDHDVGPVRVALAAIPPDKHYHLSTWCRRDLDPSNPASAGGIGAGR